MSVTLTDIIPIVRYIIGDNASTAHDIFTYTTSKIFTLTESNVATVSDVSVNDITSSVTHTYSSTTNKVNVTSGLTSGDTVQVDYTYYPNYSDTEIENYIKAALAALSVNNYETYTIDSTDSEIYPEPEDNEKNLIATITGILMEPNNRTYRLPDVTIQVPNSLPTAELVSKTIRIFKKNSHGVFFV